MPADCEAAYNEPTKYLYQNSRFVEQPYFSLFIANNTVAATLINTSSTPPTQATFTVLGETFNEMLTNGQATLAPSVYSSVVTQAINISVFATGCIGASINIGGDDSSIPLQVVTPSGGIPTVGPSGASAV